MKQNLLTKARLYEAIHKEQVDPFRPAIHFSPMVGWCNDPNGFSIYKNEYHLFYQYYPFDLTWGPMYWGHAKTKDFITWEYLPAAMAPDQPFDEIGCYSGSATELEDGRQLLIYTGCHHRHVPQVSDHTAVTRHQHQCIAVGNGIDYLKISDSPVILSDTLPDGHSHSDFRDPKVWKEDGIYYLVLTNRIADGSSVILLYKSNDGFHWSFVDELAGSENVYGTMWECPDFFSLDGKKVLLLSAHEMKDDGQEFHDGFGNIVILGDYEKEKHNFTKESVRSIDYGIDFYAPQTLLTTDGRRIMIGWMQDWDSIDYKGFTGQSFFGEMSIPRELSIRDGRLCQMPVREIASYYGTEIRHNNISLGDRISLDGVAGKTYDMTVSLHFDENLCEDGTDFRITLCDDNEYRFILSYDAKQGCLTADRSSTGITADLINVRRFFAKPKNHDMRLRFIVDRYSIEIFVNDGEQVASFLVNVSGTGVTFSSDDKIKMDVEFHEIIKK